MKVKIQQLLVLSVAAAVVSGCASTSKEVQATYVSPMAYQDFSCSQIVSESQRIQRRVSGAAGAVDDRASGDKTKMGVGLVLFWPTLFFLKGDGAEHQELARLKGEYEALEVAYTRKDCGSQSETPSVVNASTAPTPTNEVSIQSMSIRLESDGTEQVGRPCEVKAGARVWETQSGGLFQVPEYVSGPLTVVCALKEGDKVEAMILPEGGKYPEVAVIKI